MIIERDMAASGATAEECEVCDPDDGRIGNGTMSKGGTVDVEWEIESCVELICPDWDDASRYPEAFAAMWEAIKEDKHNDLTDTDAWEAFAAEIRKLAEIIAD